MKNKRLLLLLLLLALALGAWYYLHSIENKEKDIAWDRHFAVSNADQIHKVVLTNRTQEEPTVLEIIEGQWMVDGERPARPNAINNLLDVLTNMQMQSIPPYSQYETLKKDFISFSIKVQVIDRKGHILKSYYVGPDNNESDGTYFLMEGAEQFFLMELPSMKGALRPRFDLRKSAWWDRALLRYDPKDITQISVHYPVQDVASFRLRKTQESYTVEPLTEGRPNITRTFLEERVKMYLKEYQKKGVLGYAASTVNKDSIIRQIPFAELEIITQELDTQKVVFIPQSGDKLTLTSKEPNQAYNYTHWVYDPKSGDLMHGQHLALRNLFVGYSYFFSS